MKVKDWRKLLKDKKARWSLAQNLDDDADASFLEHDNAVGSLPRRLGDITARRPRFRSPLDDRTRPWRRGRMRRLFPWTNTVPKRWDWRNVEGHNWVDPVRNQGGCGSCVAFAVAAAIESHRRIESDNADVTLDLSEASLFFTADRQCNPGDPAYGWWISRALDFAMDEGICYEENYPYQPINQPAQMHDGSRETFKLSGYDSTTQTAQMKKWLREEGPLVTAYTVYSDFNTYWNGGANGVYNHVTGTVRGGHAVLTVGYDDDQSAWICKNSWGDPGYFMIGYDECGIDNRMYVPQDVVRVVTRDELRYNPRRLRIINEGARGYLLTDGRSRMKMFDTAEDARNGLRVARRHTRHGFVGRDNPRADRSGYIMEYWTGNSGLPHEPLTQVDALSYNPNNVLVEDLDDEGWRVRDGNHWMLRSHDMNDALAMLEYVERHTKICFIGRNNNRVPRDRYIMTYFE